MNPTSIELSHSVMSYFKPGMMKWHYQDGLMVYSIFNTGVFYNLEDLKKWAVSMYMPLIEENGEINTYRMGEYNLDQINSGRPLFDFFNETGDKRFLLAAENLKKQLETHPRTLSGVFWHKEIYPWQVWLDGLYMQGPFWTKCGHFDDVADQMIKVYETLRDEKTGLLYHAWDETRGQRWSDINTGLSPHFWSRSIGWYLMACLDCLDFAPEGFDDRKAKVKTIIRNLLSSIFKFQDESGMWWQVPDCKDEPGNYLETSGSSMFCYSAFKAAHLGITDEFVPMAQNGLEGICSKYLSKDENGIYHLGGICSVAGLGGNPYRDGSLKYYFCEPVFTDDFKGVGPFLLALLESEKH